MPKTHHQKSSLFRAKLRPLAAMSDLLSFGYPSESVGTSLLVHADCMEYMEQCPENTFHAIVTDPPYGLKEYDPAAIDRLNNGNNGGIWRIPPVLDGVQRSPLPRFTALSPKERAELSAFFTKWAKAALHVCRPGAHMFLASNAFMSQDVFSATLKPLR